MLKSLFKMLIVSLLGTVVITLLNISLDDKLPAILFTVCGIFFSVCMSQIMTYDISKIINERYFQSIKNSLHSIRKSFVMQFICCGIAYISYEILTENNQIIFAITIKNINFSLIVFLNVILICCLIYFVINFQEFGDVNVTDISNPVTINDLVLGIYKITVTAAKAGGGEIVAMGEISNIEVTSAPAPLPPPPPLSFASIRAHSRLTGGCRSRSAPAPALPPLPPRPRVHSRTFAVNQRLPLRSVAAKGGGTHFGMTAAVFMEI
jgi:hypothetical protein